MGPRRRNARSGGAQGVQRGGVLGLGVLPAQGARHEDQADGQGIAALVAQPAAYARCAVTASLRARCTS
ncbi:hypothetical protein [Streptomyces sp. NPDC058629]|uniref:hypothetical protein n=1 Tax=Streptomyces sp. NPDC058629 TaxID=3346565 RepID=UPI00364748C0